MEYEVSIKWCADSKAYASWLHHNGNARSSELEDKVPKKTEGITKAPAHEGTDDHRTQRKLCTGRRVESNTS